MSAKQSQQRSKKPAQAIPVDEPFEEWWPKYLARVDESVTAAEQYLAVPTGTISSIQHDPDFIATVKTYAVIEPILNDLIISARRQEAITRGLAGLTPDESFNAFVTALNISGRVGKIALAKGLGLLRQNHVHFIEGVATVRNRYAHNVKNMHRSLMDVLIELQQGNGKITEHVTGVRNSFPADSVTAALLGTHFKMFMYHRLADYLSDALHTLKPPPLPPVSALGGLMGIGAEFLKNPQA